MEDIKEIINQMVDKKVIQLSTWENVQYEGGRLFYESQNLITELSNFEPDIQMYFLERLQKQIKKRKIIIQDNTPRSVPIITGKFLNWLENRLNILKIKSYSRGDNQPENKVKQPENPYPEMFRDYKSYCLFNDFVNGADTKCYLREYSFIYRVMCEKENPALIHSHIKPGAFRTWFNEKYADLKFLPEVKTYNDAKIVARENRYHILRDKYFKTHSHTK